MRILALMILGVLVMGCGKSLTEEEKKVVGSYKRLRPEPQRFDLLENGKATFYVNGEKFERIKWKVIKKEVYIGDLIYKVEPSGDLTEIAMMHKRKRYEATDNFTWEKIK